MCATGTSFGGKGTVSTAVKAAACNAVRQWEQKKAAASTDFLDDKITSLSKEGSWDRVYAEIRKKQRSEGTEIPDVLMMSDEMYFTHVLNEEFDIGEV